MPSPESPEGEIIAPYFRPQDPDKTWRVIKSRFDDRLRLHRGVEYRNGRRLIYRPFHLREPSLLREAMLRLFVLLVALAHLLPILLLAFFFWLLNPRNCHSDAFQKAFHLINQPLHRLLDIYDAWQQSRTENR